MQKSKGAKDEDDDICNADQERKNRNRLYWRDEGAYGQDRR